MSIRLREEENGLPGEHAAEPMMQEPHCIVEASIVFQHDYDDLYDAVEGSETWNAMQRHVKDCSLQLLGDAGDSSRSTTSSRSSSFTRYLMEDVFPPTDKVKALFSCRTAYVGQLQLLVAFMQDRVVYVEVDAPAGDRRSKPDPTDGPWAVGARAEVFFLGDGQERLSRKLGQYGEQQRWTLHWMEQGDETVVKALLQSQDQLLLQKMRMWLMCMKRMHPAEGAYSVFGDVARENMVRHLVSLTSPENVVQLDDRQIRRFHRGYVAAVEKKAAAAAALCAKCGLPCTNC